MRAALALGVLGSLTVLGCGGRMRAPLPPPPARLVATAPDVFAEPPVASSGTRPPTLPEVVEHVLPNGMRLFVVVDTDMPLVSVVYASNAGGANDRDVTAGIDELLERALERRVADLDNGRPEVGIYSYGAMVWGSGATLFTTQIMGAISGIVRSPVLDEELVRTERRHLADEIVDSSHSYGVRVRDVHERTLIYGARDPRARPWYGDLDEFRALEASDLTARHHALFGPDTSALVVVGDVVAEEIRRTFEMMFASWSTPAVRGTPLPPATFPTPSARLHAFPVSGPATIALRERAPTRPHPDRAAFEVATAMLGGMFGSRINRVLREERGHTYGVHATLNDYRDYAILEIDLALPSSHVRQTVFDVIAELRRVQDASALGEDELAAARATAIASYRRRLDTRTDQAWLLAVLFMRGETLEAWGAHAASIENVTAADVARVASAWLRPDAAPILVSGEYLRMMELGMFIPGGAELVLEH